jgi:hypothetical protein
MELYSQPLDIFSLLENTNTGKIKNQEGVDAPTNLGEIQQWKRVFSMSSVLYFRVIPHFRLCWTRKGEKTQLDDIHGEEKRQLLTVHHIQWIGNLVGLDTLFVVSPREQLKPRPEVLLVGPMEHSGASRGSPASHLISSDLTPGSISRSLAARRFPILKISETRSGCCTMCDGLQEKSRSFFPVKPARVGWFDFGVTYP